MRGGDVEIRATDVDVSGLLTVLGAHLYSSPVVALRELVQNAHDSIVRRRIETGWNGGVIRVRCPSYGVIVIEDDGAGLTEQEIHSFLATIGRGYTRELREQTGSNELIGLFGLGFLSAFVLAREVVLETTPVSDPAERWVYRSAGGQRYTVARTSAGEVGTRVKLQLFPHHTGLADEPTLKRVLTRYCALLPMPVLVGEAADAVNAELPPWRRETMNLHPALRRRQKLEFATRIDNRFEPLATMDVVATTKVDARGMLWVNGGGSYATSDQRRVAVFVRGMLIDDDARELLPGWAGFVSGVIESNSLTPTASREDLQRDGVWKAVREHVAEQLITGLGEIAATQQEAWRRVLRRHNEALLGAALCDPRLFALLADQVTIPTTQGDLTAAAVVRGGGGSLHVAIESEDGLAATLFRALRTPVARGERFAVLPFVRRYVDAHDVRLVEIGSGSAEGALFQPAAVNPDDRGWLTGALADEGEVLITSTFKPADLPLIVLPDREAQLKQRIEADDADGRISSGALNLARQYTGTIESRPPARLHVNMASDAILAILQARHENPAGAELAARVLRGMKRMTNGVSGDPGAEDMILALDDIAAAVVGLCRSGDR